MISNCFGPLFHFCTPPTDQVAVKVDTVADLAHSVNTNKLPLKDLNLSLIELNSIARHLHYVDCCDIPFKDAVEAEEFVKNCSNVRHLKINSDKITYLSPPKTIETVDCSNCRALQRVAFKAIDGQGYPNLKEIKTSNCQALEWLDCSFSPKLTKIDCTNSLALKALRCKHCPTLETIISDSLPRCTWVNHSHCPLLRQLPQLPPGATVFCYNSIEFVSFEVDPEDLKTNPLQVLNHLGDAILKDKRMPNVVYLNSLGLDAGGLRRQLVTSLMQNQFPPEAYKTIGMLIALAVLGSLPLGRVLKDNFYYALLQIEEDTPEKMIQSLALYGVPDAEIETVEQSITLPLSLAAKGFREIADPKKFRKIPLADFVTRVAGLEATWENFDKLTLYKGDDNGNIRGYFETFFKKNPQLICDMIELFTASRGLGVEKIKIFVNKTLDKRKLFTMNTCFQQVVLPSYDTYELFEAKLLKTMEHTLGHFDKE